jgi:5-methylthioadenosine/S-adenosylhomocysteine deaminase
MSVLFRQARIFSFDPERQMSGPTDVLVRDGHIAAIGLDLPVPERPDDRIVDAPDHLLMPGLVNGHFHSSVNHMKGALDSLPLEIFMLYESPALEALKPSPREAYVRTMLAALEMLKLGVTAVQDDAFFVPHPTPGIIDAVMQAYADCGIRARMALDQPNIAELDKLPFLADLLPAKMRAELSHPPAFNAPSLLAAYGHLIGTWHGHDGGRIEAAAAARDRRLFPRPRRAEPPPRPALLHPHAGDEVAAGIRRGVPGRPIACSLCR